RNTVVERSRNDPVEIPYFHPMKKFLFLILVALYLYACKDSQHIYSTKVLDMLAEKYVRLALYIGQYDEVFVDAYYGPDSLKPKEKPKTIFPKDSLLTEVKVMVEALDPFMTNAKDSLSQHRALWIHDQLMAFSRRIKIFSGEYGTFDEESKDLFGTVAPTYDEAHFKEIVNQLDAILPGEGAVADRFQALANHFIIPKEKLDTVFKAAIAECRKRTLAHYTLPSNEDFKLEFVTDKSWSGYNWYKGNYQSLIQINTDLNIFVDRAIDVGSHESYPGHHVYNMLLEKNLYHDKGLVEISVYPLFSPQSLIAEGSANYGIDVVFPGNDKVEFAKNVLLPLAGLDTTGIALYFKALVAKGKLNYVRNEVGRQMLGGTMDETEALRWLEEYGLNNHETALKGIAFIKSNRTYVINYNYGMDLVGQWVEKQLKGSTDPEMKWKVFGDLLSNQVRIKDLSM
ncbi:MAG TPA: hypothetical protein VFV79_08310, partial [Saprospiraceae bacterium]|nr:hypothetical protein [Saprospiraceae bacterium]